MIALFEALCATQHWLSLQCRSQDIAPRIRLAAQITVGNGDGDVVTGGGIITLGNGDNDMVTITPVYAGPANTITLGNGNGDVVNDFVPAIRSE